MARSKSAFIAAIIALAAVPTAIFTIHPSAIALADSCFDAVANVALPSDTGACADVLAQEARWLMAITAGDLAAIDSILSPNYKHINAEGQQFDRAQEIASTKKLPFTMNPSEQVVDIAGDTAVIHGVNTLMQDGKVLSCARFTDVFVLRGGTWMALSAQETTI